MASPERDMFRILPFSCCTNSSSARARHVQDLAFFLLYLFRLRLSATFSGSCLFLLCLFWLRWSATCSGSCLFRQNRDYRTSPIQHRPTERNPAVPCSPRTLEFRVETQRGTSAIAQKFVLGLSRSRGDPGGSGTLDTGFRTLATGSGQGSGP